jgi:hypothetical protein
MKHMTNLNDGKYSGTVFSMRCKWNNALLFASKVSTSLLSVSDEGAPLKALAVLARSSP